MDRSASDERLLADFAAGHRAALGELARRYETALLGLCAGVLGGARDLACDAVQETWIRVIRFASQFDGKSSFKTWLYRIAINQCLSLRRVNARSGCAVRDLGSVSHDRSVGIAQLPESTATVSESNGVLRAAVELLPAERRDAVLLCYHAGMTHEQAAEILEIPLGTLKSRLHAALADLRAQFLPENAP